VRRHYDRRDSTYRAKSRIDSLDRTRCHLSLGRLYAQRWRDRTLDQQPDETAAMFRDMDMAY
jgi:hypothetical protein